MGLRAAANVFLYSATRLEDVLREVMAMRPRAVIVDSIQTVYLDDVAGSAGSVSQARAPRAAAHPEGVLGFGNSCRRASMLAIAVACEHLAPSAVRLQSVCYRGALPGRPPATDVGRHMVCWLSTPCSAEDLWRCLLAVPDTACVRR